MKMGKNVRNSQGKVKAVISIYYYNISYLPTIGIVAWNSITIDIFYICNI